MSYELLDAIRKIPAKELDMYGKFQETLEAETFCYMEELLKQDIDEKRIFVRAGHDCGLNTQALVRYYEADEFKLSATAYRAWLTAFFAGGERGARIGAQAAIQMMEDSEKFAKGFIAATAPWLHDVEALEDDD